MVNGFAEYSIISKDGNEDQDQGKYREGEVEPTVIRLGRFRGLIGCLLCHALAFSRETAHFSHDLTVQHSSRSLQSLTVKILKQVVVYFAVFLHLCLH